MLSPKQVKKRLDKLPKEEDLNWLCFDCGIKRYGRKPGVCTIHQGFCDLCGKLKNVTEPRDFRNGAPIRR